MALFNRFPFSNAHELNLDWILLQLQELNRKIDQQTETDDFLMAVMGTTSYSAITAAAAAGKAVFCVYNNRVYNLTGISGGSANFYTANGRYGISCSSADIWTSSAITPDYNDLQNKPQINGNTLEGDKSSADLGLADAGTFVDVDALKSAYKISNDNQYDLTTEQPGFFNSSGVVGSQGSPNIEVYSDYIPVPSGATTMYFKFWLLTANNPSAWIRACTYDANKVFIESVSGNITSLGTDGEYNIYRRTFNLSLFSGAKFFRISYRTFGRHKAQIYFDYETNYNISARDIINGASLGGRRSHPFDAYPIRGIAHRGLCGSPAAYPENTIYAFRNAVTNGFKFFETDLRFTSDNYPVLLHDASINRTARNADGTTIGTTTNIANITKAQADQYDYGIWKGAEFAGTGIPTLYDALEFCRETNTFLVLDCALTSSARSNLMAAAQDIVDMGMQDYIRFVSSNELVLLSYLAVYQGFEVGLQINGDLTDEKKTMLTTVLKNPFNTVYMAYQHEQFSMYQSAVLQFAADNQIPIDLWTVDAAATMEGFPHEVTGVVSNTTDYRAVRYAQAMGT